MVWGGHVCPPLFICRAAAPGQCDFDCGWRSPLRHGSGQPFSAAIKPPLLIMSFSPPQAGEELAVGVQRYSSRRDSRPRPSAERSDAFGQNSLNWDEIAWHFPHARVKRNTTVRGPRLCRGPLSLL
jgi:hypothetical protein